MLIVSIVATLLAIGWTLVTLPVVSKVGLALVWIIVAALWLGWYFAATHQKCVFDRNDLGPKDANGGQWWYDVFKCPDGTERRVLVAGRRG